MFPDQHTGAVLRGDDLPADGLDGRTVVVHGYGNQGRAHARNLRDAGVPVLVGGRADGDGIARARADGFEADAHDRIAARADLAIIALPDEVQPTVLAESIVPALRPGATLGFVHGFTVRYGLLDAPDGIGVVMVAPKGPGPTLRARFLADQGIPALLAVERENQRGDARAIALAWARGLGCHRAGVILSTFAEETESDLFGEQAVLCGGLMALVQAAFETLVDAGFSPEVAYIECCHEVKQVTDLLYVRGPGGMRAAISNTAEFGAFEAIARVDDEHLRAHMRAVLADVRSGAFAHRFRADHETGGRWFAARRAEADRHPIERASANVRALMPFLEEEQGSGSG